AVERSGPGVPVLGMIPSVAAWRGRETPLLRRDQPTTPSAEAYRGLAATVQRILPHRPLRSIAVTSPGQADGKTTVSANLADVLVIDVPAVEPTGDAAVVASIVDAALVIAGAPSGQAADLARAVDLLDGIDGLVVGVVLNAVEDPDTDGRVAMLRQNQPRVSLA